MFDAPVFIMISPIMVSHKTLHIIHITVVSKYISTTPHLPIHPPPLKSPQGPSPDKNNISRVTNAKTNFASVAVYDIINSTPQKTTKCTILGILALPTLKITPDPCPTTFNYKMVYHKIATQPLS